MIPAPRVNVVPMPPTAPHIMAPRPPPMVVPTGKSKASKRWNTLKLERGETNASVYLLLAFVPAPPMPQPPPAVPAPPVHPPPPREDEPTNKKMKTEDNLIPEEEFLRRNKVCWSNCALKIFCNIDMNLKKLLSTELVIFWDLSLINVSSINISLSSRLALMSSGSCGRQSTSTEHAGQDRMEAKWTSAEFHRPTFRPGK